MPKLLPLLLLWSALALGAGVDLEALRRAAEGGDGYAQLNLGAAYDHGLGVRADPAQAEQWYRRAAVQGVAEAQFNLGHLLVVRGNPAEGARWLAAAAEQGMADAQYLLGVIYAEGMGVVPDAALARHWLQRAAAQGQEEARAYLEAGVPPEENAPE